MVAFALFYFSFLLMLSSMAGFISVMLGAPFFVGAVIGFIFATLLGYITITID